MYYHISIFYVLIHISRPAIYRVKGEPCLRSQKGFFWKFAGVEGYPCPHPKIHRGDCPASPRPLLCRCCFIVTLQIKILT